MSTRWATLCLCALAPTTGLLAAGAPATAEVQHEATAGSAPTGTGATNAASAAAAVPSTSVLTLRAQTPWVTPAAPWFSLAVGVGASAGPVSDLHVQLTFYNRIRNGTELGQATNAVPDKTVLRQFNAAVAVTADGAIATTCTTVLPTKTAQAPTTVTTVPPNSVPCTATDPTVVLGCTPDEGACGGVYPVSVALYRQGTTTALARYTTFLTYQEPGFHSSIGPGGALRVGLIIPLSVNFSPDFSPPSKTSLKLQEEIAGVLTSHRGIPLTVAANPATVQTLDADTKSGRRTRDQLASLTVPGGDELIDQPYVPIDVAALAGGGLLGEIPEQLTRGDSLLRQAGLHPTPGPWVDTSSTFTSASATNLGLGLQAAHTDRVVLADTNLASAGTSPLTFAQTFSLALGSGNRVTGAAADSQLSSFFRADPRDPVLAANQLLAALEFTHFENPSLLDARGIVLEPQGAWLPSSPAFLATLLEGMSGNPALQPVTLSQFFSEVHKGGNNEPASRHLQSGPTPRVITAGQARRLVAARAHLTSLSDAASSRPPVFTELADQLLATQNLSFDPAQRTSSLDLYTQHFDDEVGLVSLADLGTITFTSRTAPIPISVLSHAPYAIKVTVSVDSDKFSFPDGNSRSLTLDRPTTAVRIQARSRTSGDRLPVGVTLTTPDGQLVIARATLTVHSTSISLVGVALTCLAALVLLVWWARTWRRGRRRGPRAA